MLRHLVPSDKRDKLGSLFDRVPNASDAIGHRFNELKVPDLVETLEIYMSALDIVNYYTGRLKRRSIIMDSAKFLIQAPPWVQPLSEHIN